MVMVLIQSYTDPFLGTLYGAYWMASSHSIDQQPTEYFVFVWTFNHVLGVVVHKLLVQV